MLICMRENRIQVALKYIIRLITSVSLADDFSLGINIYPNPRRLYPSQVKKERALMTR